MVIRKLTRNRLVPGTVQGYNAVHRRLRLLRGKASNFECACGAMAYHWAYDRQAPDEKWCHLGPYSSNLLHYRALCRKCHCHLDPPRTEAQKLAVRRSTLLERRASSTTEGSQ